jgi:hypothetical protein
MQKVVEYELHDHGAIPWRAVSLNPAQNAVQAHKLPPYLTCSFTTVNNFKSTSMKKSDKEPKQNQKPHTETGHKYTQCYSW